MYNMQAVVRKSINNATMQFEKLGYIANNLANYNTAAYKTSRFEQILREDGYVDGAIRTNALQGSIKVTNNPYDIAIDGEGYIPVVSADGEIQYTRDGALKRGENGYLMTVDDWMVGDGINDSPALSEADAGIAISDGAAIAREISDITISAESLWELVKLREIAIALMERIRSNYRFVIGFNGTLIGLGLAGILSPAASAALHNLSTLGVSLRSMSALPQQKQKQDGC